MGSYNVDYHVVIELSQILHKLGRGRSCDHSKHTNLSKNLICLLLHYATTKMSKKVVLHEEPFLNPPEREVGGDSLRLRGGVDFKLDSSPPPAVSIEVGLPFLHRSHFFLFRGPSRNNHEMEMFYFLLCNWGHFHTA